MSKAIIVCVWLLGACATGGSEGNAADRIDAAVVRSDASTVTTPDAPRSDAGTSPDAQSSQLPDAGSGGGLFCTANSQCTVSGECCLTLGGPSGFCAPGTVILNECVPF